MLCCAYFPFLLISWNASWIKGEQFHPRGLEETRTPAACLVLVTSSRVAGHIPEHLVLVPPAQRLTLSSHTVLTQLRCSYSSACLVWHECAPPVTRCRRTHAGGFMRRGCLSDMWGLWGNTHCGPPGVFIYVCTETCAHVSLSAPTDILSSFNFKSVQNTSVYLRNTFIWWSVFCKTWESLFPFGQITWLLLLDIQFPFVKHLVIRFDWSH